ncbi:Fe-S cluster assembly protein SufD [uncultured Porphyromonas sp.]|uniref:Fe-S cluster assembly protein SufD n=1 Tax=uncultured Porphyromonas sp. TaxID=159274 RepID=UPI00261AFB69|nr:Fe-S cluster assembly protein SufD [uncultured Porphyromonas sp.]
MKKSKRKEAQLALAQHFLSQYQPAPAHPLLERDRTAAKEYLAQNGLPIYREEDYQYFKIDEWLSQEWRLSSAPRLTETEAKSYACRLTYPDVVQAYLIGGKVAPMPEEEGYFAGPIDEFSRRYPEVAERYYNQMTSTKEARLTQLNSLYCEDLFVYYIPEGVHLKCPLHLIHYATSSKDAGQTLTFPRLLVIAEAESEATLLFCDHGNREETSGYIGAIEIYVERGAKFNYYNIEESSPHSLRIMDTHIQQAEDSIVVVDNVTVQNGATRNNYFCDLVGQRASIDLDGLGLLDDSKRLDNWSFVRHSSPNCHSDQLFKYTMNDTSIGGFSGRIYVAPDAQKTEAYQNNRNLLLSEQAKMFSKPQLEIYADDVKCSHGMTTGELSEQAIFYMRQRGIPLMEAKLMLTVAFMSDVLEKIDYLPLRERLITTIDKRYRGLPASCR